MSGCRTSSPTQILYKLLPSTKLFHLTITWQGVFVLPLISWLFSFGYRCDPIASETDAEADADADGEALVMTATKEISLLVIWALSLCSYDAKKGSTFMGV